MADRLRKAWSVGVRGVYSPTLVYAPTASKARSKAIADLSDAWVLTWREALQQIEYVRRAPSHDVALPAQHKLAPQLHPEILHCVVHAYGGTGLKAGYRDHFYTGADNWRLQAALYHGLFRVYRRDPGRTGRPDQIMYELTALGRNVARGEVETYPRW